MADENNNGKVTMAVVSQQILTLTDEVKALRKLLSDVPVLDERVNNLRDDVDNLETRVNRWSSLNSFAAVVAAVLGVMIDPRK